MNTTIKQLIATIATLAATSSVMAGEYVQADEGFVSTKSRADVIAELRQARISGDQQFIEYAYPIVQFDTTKTRAEVMAELQSARTDGSAEFREDSYPSIRVTGTPKTREQVQAELRKDAGERSVRANDYTMVGA